MRTGASGQDPLTATGKGSQHTGEAPPRPLSWSLGEGSTVQGGVTGRLPAGRVGRQAPGHLSSPSRRETSVSSPSPAAAAAVSAWMGVFQTSCS